MIRELMTPEDHHDPYIWAAVLFAHGFICQILVCILLMIFDPIPAFLIVSSAYLLLWEAVQIYFIPSWRIALDGMLDWLGVSCGTLAVVSVYMDRLIEAVFIYAVVIAMAIIGYQRRKWHFYP